jgi:uncharacterized membrane protein YgdD (TMEM256/DUF423 family)
MWVAQACQKLWVAHRHSTNRSEWSILPGAYSAAATNAMPTNAKFLIVIGALAGAAGVALGAFGAHALKARLAPEALALWQTAVQYHFWHALGLIAIGIIIAVALPGSTALKWAGWLMVAGLVLFSGSLYALALGAPRGLGAITPLGGTAWIAAWILLAWAVIRA